MSVSPGEAWPQQAFQGTTETIKGGGGGSERLGDRMFEEFESGMSGGRGKEEDHVEAHRVESGSSPPGFCGG